MAAKKSQTYSTLRVSSRSGKQFCRCGLRFNKAPVDLTQAQLDALGEEGIERLMAEPALVVQEVEVEAPTEAETKAE